MRHNKNLKLFWNVHFLFLAFTVFLVAPTLHAETSDSFPIFLSDLANPNDFSNFANGGWDGNWYVGYNACWIQKLKCPPQKNIQRAFVGVKMGRMKSIVLPGLPPWERKAIEGEVYVAIASTPSWSRKQSFFLTKSNDIPLEPDLENAIEGVSESRWFWREIPLDQIPFDKDAYVAVWSPSEIFTNASNSPILAAGWGNKEINSWLNNDIKGLPPTKPEKAIATPVTIFEPAIAIKLIPEQTHKTIPTVKIISVQTGEPQGKYPAPKIIQSSVIGESIERTWVEISTDSKTWTKYNRYQWTPPYTFSIKMHEVPIGSNGKTWIRVQAADVFENIGTSDPMNLLE